MKFQFTVQLKIQKPAAEVFDAVYDPANLTKYFISASSGPMEAGATLQWTHTNDKGESFTHPVHVKSVVRGRLIRFTWPASEGVYDAKAGKFPRAAGYDNEVVFEFDTLGPAETLVRVTEGGWRETEDGLASSYQNCQGWMQMVCAMKGLLEYGINLRKGAF
jgi:uncharacterized protein YndB with AHSA1/START domain